MIMCSLCEYKFKDDHMQLVCARACVCEREWVTACLL